MKHDKFYTSQFLMIFFGRHGLNTSRKQYFHQTSTLSFFFTEQDNSITEYLHCLCKKVPNTFVSLISPLYKYVSPSLTLKSLNYYPNINSESKNVSIIYQSNAFQNTISSLENKGNIQKQHKTIGTPSELSITKQ